MNAFVATKTPSRPLTKKIQRPIMFPDHFVMLVEMIGQDVFLMRPDCPVVFTAPNGSTASINILLAAGIIRHAAGVGNYEISLLGMNQALAYLDMSHNTGYIPNNSL